MSGALAEQLQVDVMGQADANIKFVMSADGIVASLDRSLTGVGIVNAVDVLLKVESDLLAML